jgi:hypothetical protein
VATWIRISSDILLDIFRAHDEIQLTARLCVRYGDFVIPAVYQGSAIEFRTVSSNDTIASKQRLSYSDDSKALNVSLSFDEGNSFILCGRLKIFKAPSPRIIEPQNFVPGLHSSITIIGDDFPLLDAVKCVVGEFSYSARIVTVSLITCDIENSSDINDELTFLSVNLYWLASVWPSYVLQDGGEVISVHGYHLAHVGSKGKMILKNKRGMKNKMVVKSYLFIDIIWRMLDRKGK